jgi:hypothetical protein
MPILQIQHAVRDFDAWKRAFDSDPVGRQQGGVRRYRILRAADDPNFVVIELEFDTQMRPTRSRRSSASFGAASVTSSGSAGQPRGLWSPSRPTSTKPGATDNRVRRPWFSARDASPWPA